MIIKPLNDFMFQNYPIKSKLLDVYYLSTLTNSYLNYHIILPNKYDSNNEYSLMVFFARYQLEKTHDKELSSAFLIDLADCHNSVIAVIDPTDHINIGRIGGIYLLNKLEHIINNFSISKNNIYVIATEEKLSNMIMNLAIAKPHLLSGIYVTNIQPPFNGIKNLSNTNCLFVFNNKNKIIERNIKFIKDNLPRCKIINAKEYQSMLKNQALLDWLEPITKNSVDSFLKEFPDNINFWTASNRFLQAFYINIESIEKGKLFAEVNSVILGNTIKIKTKNCTGIKINLPPQIKTNDFMIQINGKVFTFIDYYKKDIIFKHQVGKGYYIGDTLTENIDYYYWTGLMDVYLTPLRIINCDTQNSTLCEVSKTFANPQSAITTDIKHFNYPIIPQSGIDNCKCHSMIIIDNNCKPSDSLEYIRSKLHIKMDDTGYEYNGIVHKGEYCILQLIKNPWYNNRSIVYINTNDKKLYYKNLFTRQNIFISQVDYLPYQNSISILFDGNNYQYLSDWGNEFLDF